MSVYEFVHGSFKVLVLARNKEEAEIKIYDLQTQNKYPKEGWLYVRKLKMISDDIHLS